MTVIAPPPDTAGAALDAAIATAQALVNKTPQSSVLYPQYFAQLNQLQVQAVDHYMVTGWLNAAAILQMYSPQPGDAAGKLLAARVTFLQNLFNNAPPPPPGNVNGYGGSGWVTVAQNYQQQLYAAQIALVERIMSYPGGTSAATILANMTGAQTDPAGIPYQYVFNSVGFTDAWLDD